ncbi:hypothetical protein [Kitasatospora sp. NBC_01302]|uniref:hypothetical protein n=1 Tax=Kitasatospora sp. NBC_01302 TaxID=2903575 RepID=UPI002E0D8814|nr:hypothetical protein OG294_00420 [Kitasatospora sp. NBC_01302]
MPPTAVLGNVLTSAIAVLVGGALPGLAGALVAVPAAVALGLVLDEYVFPRTDNA